MRSSGTRSTRCNLDDELDMMIAIADGLVDLFGDEEGKWLALD